MGPPLKAAENESVVTFVVASTACSFNGAAAKSSGKFTTLDANEDTDTGFNGAAAKSSGKCSDWS